MKIQIEKWDDIERDIRVFLDKTYSRAGCISQNEKIAALFAIVEKLIAQNRLMRQIIEGRKTE